jgi:peptide/nickel transport system substrate-binding protein
MTRRDVLRLDAIRRRSSPIENHIIDEYAAGKITRRDFVRRGTILGMSIPVLGFIASACASDETTTTLGGAVTTAGGPATTGAPGTTGATATTGAAGTGTIRAAMITPAGAIDPVLTNDEGRLAILGQTGQYLTFSDAELNVLPVLAESWEPNDTLDVWTFHLRQGVTYHDGSPMVAADVVAVFNNIAEGNAASAYETFGVDPANIVALDDATVEFTLARPNGSFPFFVSSDNYNAIIVPASFWDGYAEGSYEAEFPGTGIWQIENLEQGVRPRLSRTRTTGAITAPSLSASRCSGTTMRQWRSVPSKRDEWTRSPTSPPLAGKRSWRVRMRTSPASPPPSTGRCTSTPRRRRSMTSEFARPWR